MTGYDAVVVGAGPAGGVAALRLARAGVRTLLVEKRAFPRHKVCGCCLAPAGQGVLDRCGALSVLEGASTVERLEMRHRAGSVSAHTPTYCVLERSVMDQRLIDLFLDAGGACRLGVGARVIDGGVGIGGTEIRARVVLCADGLAGSSLRDRPSFGWEIDRAARVGVGCVVDDVEGDARDAITMCVGDAGYCGVARTSEGRGVVAAALRTGAVRDAGARESMLGLLEEGGVRARSERDALRGAPGLTRQRTAFEEDGRVFVVGDASGYVEPFTGEGMSWALRAGELVFDHAMAALDGSYERGAWSACVERERGRSTLGCRAVTAVLRRPVLTGLCARTARLVPGVASAVARRVVAA